MHTHLFFSYAALIDACKCEKDQIGSIAYLTVTESATVVDGKLHVMFLYLSRITASDWHAYISHFTSEAHDAMLPLIHRISCRLFLLVLAGPHRRGGLHTESPGRLGRFSRDVVDLIVQHHAKHAGKASVNRPWFKSLVSRVEQEIKTTGLPHAGKGLTSDFISATRDVFFGWGGGGQRQRALAGGFAAPPDISPDAIDAEDGSFDSEFDPTDLRPFRTGGIYMASTVDSSCQV